MYVLFPVRLLPPQLTLLGGDGSMEVTMSSQKDSTPWEVPPALISKSSSRAATPTTDSQKPIFLRGRGYFSLLGAVRTKPGRADSPETLSKSCSDKLALKQCLSVLSMPVSYLLSPENAYISTITLPRFQISDAAIARAFSVEGRMAPLKDRIWSDTGYRFQPFKVGATNVEFQFSKARVTACSPTKRAKSSNISAAWVSGRKEEVLIQGVKQGQKTFSGLWRSGSILCKAKMWNSVIQVAGILGLSKLAECKSYSALKAIAEERNRVKQEVRTVLGGWTRNGGNNFELGAVDEKEREMAGTLAVPSVVSSVES